MELISDPYQSTRSPLVRSFLRQDYLVTSQQLSDTVIADLVSALDEAPVRPESGTGQLAHIRPDRR